ncbi:MAG: hypothetical protein FJW26_03935 [Acidimicrobiia bacterium]|nr:hypothetical protein [Acidimicrobiia bacterium]
MSEHPSKEDQSELALGYSLGLLDPAERQCLEAHLSAGCADCDAEVSSFSQVARALSLSPPSVAPPARLRSRLLQAVAGCPVGVREGAGSSWRIVRTAELSWRPSGRQGLWEKRLLYDPVQCRSTRLIKLDPGASIPAHRHRGDEESMVLEGVGRFGELAFGPCDYHRASSRSLHPPFLSESGCVCLIFSGSEHEFLSETNDGGNVEHLLTIRSGSGTWTRLHPGLETQVLYAASEPRGDATKLFRLGAGGMLAPSDFAFSEAFVLDGGGVLGTVEIAAGDYLQRIEATPVEVLRSPQGCILLTRSESL